MANLLVVPVVLPLAAGAFLLLVRPPERIRRLLTLAVAAILVALPVLFTRFLGEAGMMVLRLGGWEPPFGIVFAVDWLSILMLFFCNLVGLCVVIFAAVRFAGPGPPRPYLHALLLFQIAGVNGALSTGDLFNLYVWYEVMLIASYALVARGGTRRTMKGVPDYMVMNVLASLLFLVGVGLTYASFGTLNLAHLGWMVQRGPVPGWMPALAMVFFVVFASKSAAFPLYFWIYRGYPRASCTVAALLGGLLTKVGIYSFLRVFPLMFPLDRAAVTGWARGVFYIVGALSILVGVFGALSRSEWREILSHHVTSQIGYMIAGIGLWTPLALAGTLYFTLHNIVVKSGLFLLGGIGEAATGSTRLKSQGGLLAVVPAAGVLFAVASFSLAGLPPMSGFFSKFVLFSAAVRVGGLSGYGLLAVGVVGGLFTLYSMVKIWRFAFQGTPASGGTSRPVAGGLYVGPAVLVIVSLLMGVGGGGLMNATSRAAHQLLHPASYVQRVLRDSPVLRTRAGTSLAPRSPGGSSMWDRRSADTIRSIPHTSREANRP